MIAIKERNGMLTTVFSAGFEGICGFICKVECNIYDRLPSYSVVGLPDNAVKESRERIRSSLEQSGFKFPYGEIIINLAPADKKKSGTSFDLALLLGMVTAARTMRADISDSCFIGELSLSGEIRPVNGVLCMCLAARDAGLKKVYVPYDNAGEASVVDGVTVYGVKNVTQLFNHLNGKEFMEPTVYDKNEFYNNIYEGLPDFADVKGQELAKKALEIAAAGGHNILLIGPPGTGKSMLAKRLPGILPPLTFDEALQTTKVYSIMGSIPPGKSIVARRPFRSPHHTMSAVSLSGGGAQVKPGEVSLAHNGVLFLDELPEFPKSVTETLRQPLEDRVISITRASGHFTFPSSFMLVCAMNPCKCGYFGHPTIKCTCREEDVRKYMSRISGPLLDRIDIQIEVPALNFEQLSSTRKSEPSSAMRERVLKAREFALNRYRANGCAANCNAELESKDITTFCRTDDKARALLKNAYDKLGLSARGYDRVLRLSRTIADLDGSEDISVRHVAEAIQLRSLDRKYYGQG